MSKKQYLKKLDLLMRIVRCEFDYDYYVVSEPRNYQLRYFGTDIAVIKSKSRVDFLHQLEEKINEVIEYKNEVQELNEWYYGED